MDPDREFHPFFLFLLIVFILIFAGLFTPFRDRIGFKLDDIKSRLFYRMNAPEQTVFVPQGAQGVSFSTTDSLPDVSVTPYLLTELPAETEFAMATEAVATSASAEPSLQPTQTAMQTITPTPTETPVPLPPSAAISGVKYEDQHGIWNYCAPTNLSMAMTFWGWDGDRIKAGKWLKPFDKDKNVMFYEMENFVREMSGLRSVVRTGGTPELLKQLIVAGFPVLIEKGAYMQEVNGRLSWMGHYNVVTGYDDAEQEWTVQDSYYRADYKVSYDLLQDEWRSFNFQFMVVYPGEKEAELYETLGPYTNNDWVTKNTMAIAEKMIQEAEDSESYYFAYFNRGSTQIDMNDFYGAAQSYDMAFKYYAELDAQTRPYRMVWYQTGPYLAYYYSGRYSDVISLADITLASTQEPFLEESYYWRAMAYFAIGNMNGAESDARACLEVHPAFPVCDALLAKIGVP